MKIYILGLSFLFSSLFAQDELRKSIYFDGGSYEISFDQQEFISNWLDSIPNLLEKYQIELISHTDPVGGRRFNQWLSGMRSQQVKKLLLQRFIPAEMIYIRDWGFERPIYDNNTSSGRIRNRRVDVIVRPLAF